MVRVRRGGGRVVLVGPRGRKGERESERSLDSEECRGDGGIVDY